jgi:hypothetical protein
MFKMSRVVVVLHFSSHEQSVLVTASRRTGKGYSKSHDNRKAMDATHDEKNKLFCDYCHKSRHTQETCWRLYGRPP